MIGFFAVFESWKNAMSKNQRIIAFSALDIMFVEMSAGAADSFAAGLRSWHENHLGTSITKNLEVVLKVG